MPVHPLKVAIAADGRPQYAIAAAAGVHPNIVSGIVHGRSRATGPVRERLAAVLGQPVEALFPLDEVSA